MCSRYIVEQAVDKTVCIVRFHFFLMRVCRMAAILAKSIWSFFYCYCQYSALDWNLGATSVDSCLYVLLMAAGKRACTYILEPP